jgi:hypothetical protein
MLRADTSEPVLSGIYAETTRNRIRFDLTDAVASLDPGLS